MHGLNGELLRSSSHTGTESVTYLTISRGFTVHIVVRPVYRWKKPLSIDNHALARQMRALATTTSAGEDIDTLPESFQFCSRRPRDDLGAEMSTNAVHSWPSFP